MTRLLAVDPGSVALGLAAFDGRDLVPGSARAIRGRGPDWHARMRSITAQLWAHLAGEWRPDVVAIEGVVLQRGPRANPRTLAVMAQTRGYLIARFDEMYPTARVIEINPQKTRSVVGAPRSRARGKQHIAWAVQALTGTDPGSEDARDAIAVGLAALEQLRAESLAAFANRGSGGLVPS